MDTLFLSGIWTAIVLVIYMFIRNEWVFKTGMKYIQAMRTYALEEFDTFGTEKLENLFNEIPDYDDIFCDWFNWTQKQFIKDPILFEKLQKYL